MNFLLSSLDYEKEESPSVKGQHKVYITTAWKSFWSSCFIEVCSFLQSCSVTCALSALLFFQSQELEDRNDARNEENPPETKADSSAEEPEVCGEEEGYGIEGFLSEPDGELELPPAASESEDGCSLHTASSSLQLHAVADSIPSSPASSQLWVTQTQTGKTVMCVRWCWKAPPRGSCRFCCLTTCAFLLLPSFVASPCSSVCSEDLEALQAHRIWKKAIMLVWRAAANHRSENSLAPHWAGETYFNPFPQTSAGMQMSSCSL